MVLKKTYALIFLLYLCVPVITIAQFNSEIELKKEAEKLFAEKKYTEAMPLFGQLASLYPKEANYNFKYGACLIFGDKDKEKPLRFLRFAISKPEVDPLSHYFMGKALHLNYYFKDAIESYSKFIAKVPAKNRADYNAEREIEMCRNGIKLLSDIKDVDVVGKKETRKDEFYRTYDLKGIGGKIVAKPDDFRSKFDKKLNDYSVIYLPQNLKNEVFFASYGEDGKSGKDIYKVLRLPNGEWGKPVSIGAPINTPYDEDFPFMHPDGKTLYFSSKGHNSMGGYDIFKTVFNENTNTWSTPQNLDFAYSSPDDDFFFVTDEDMTLAYFASSRASKEGEITVYRVKVQPKSADFVIIKGEFINEGNPPMRTAKVTVTDLSNNQNMGEYFTNTSSGKYAILLPGKGGKYKFAIETTETAPIHSGMVEVPRQQDEVVALKQELRLVGKGDNEKLVIKNLFDQTEAFDINDPLLVESIIRQKAKLDINATEAQVLASVQELQEDKNKNTETKEIPRADEFKDFSNNDIAEKAKTIEKELKQKIDTLQNESNYAYSVSNGKSRQAKENSDKADKILNSLASYSATDRSVKENEAQLLKEEARKLSREVLAAKKIAASLDNDIAELTSEFNTVSQLASAIQYDISANNRIAAIDKLKKQQELIASINQTPTSKTIEKNSLAEKAKQSKAETEKAENNLSELAERKNEIEKEITQLNSQLSTAKKKDKENIEAKLKALEIDKEDIAYQYEDEQKRVSALKKESNNLEAELAQFETVSKQVEDNKTIVSPPTLQQKTETETTIARLEEKGLTTSSAEQKSEQKITETKSNKIDLLALKNDYDIITDEGKIKNYNNDFSNQLADADKIADSNLRNDKIAEINKKWANAIQQEIEITQKQIEASETLNDKTQLTSKRNKLIDFKEQKEKDANSTSNLIASNENSSAKTDKTEIYSKEYNNKLNEIQANANLSATEKEKNKINVLKEWNQKIEEELKQKKSLVGTEKSEEEKNETERKIIQLEEQYTQNQQQIENSENAIVQANNESFVEKNQQKTEGKTSNFEEVSAIKYNPTLTYKNENAKQWLAETNTLKQEASSLMVQSEVLREKSNQTDNPQERNNLITQADELEQKSETTQLQIAEKYAKANQEEYQRNKNVLNSNSFINAANKSDDATLANMLKEEADFYFIEAQKIREEINDNMYFAAKKTALQKAYDYETKALQKQQQAFAIANYNASETELANNNASESQNNTNNQSSSSVDTNENANNNSSTQNNLSEVKTEFEEQTVPLNKENTLQANNEEQKNIIENTSKADIEKYAITTPETAENKRAERLLKEAEELEQKSTTLTTQASTTRKKKEKEALVLEAQKASAEANAKRSEAAELKESSEEKVKESESLIAASKILQQKNSDALASNNERQMASGLSDSELRAINNNSSYTQYAKEKQEARRLAKEAEVEYLQSLRLMNEANESQLKADELKRKAEDESDDVKKEELLNEADKQENIVIEKEKESTKIAENAKVKEKQIVFHENQAQFAIADLAPEQADKIEAVEKTAFSDVAFKNRLEKIAEVQTIITENNSSTNQSQTTNENTSTSSQLNATNSTNTNLVVSGTLSEIAKIKIPQKLETNIFAKSNSNQAAYNNTNPIPANTVEPEGLVFKVQVGAFRNPIPQDHFKGFAPIVTEPGPNGITRYTAGYFKDFSVADNAKIDIRGLGYSDAFVVAFLNGKRINIDQARAMLTRNQTLAANTQAPENNRTNSNATNIGANANNSASTNTNRPQPNANNINDGFSTNVQSIKGFFYTVQVGVYSGIIKPAILNNIENINSDRLPNNLVRYSSGQYKTPEEAMAIRQQIIAKGITDAFVTAYIDGQRYTVDQARRMLEQNRTNSSLNTNNSANNTSSSVSNTSNTSNNSVNNNISSGTAEVKEYRVNIGEYADDIPNDVAGVYLQLTGRGIKSYEKGDKTVYLIGSFDNFEDAEKLKKEMQEMGIKGAKVVTYVNDKETDSK
ncbi:hypothetical protein FLAV_02100 [Flavobacteriales bacterium]|nr:hypothetical protein [Flavobacteriales bacterium]MCL4817066.1 PD40 domain-containing protein [Flavobacteriales bacterium]WKZ76070.1 MAG: hypothetical protein QY303_04065 [Vicingaceae bacterium]GIK70507.1 MAG: hypothetical protein BroJett020_18020 [Bacteroidota bacterium]CAG0987125.1 hypothetical protein FLAV_02100 [Flavobacteriales bacterium]